MNLKSKPFLILTVRIVIDIIAGFSVIVLALDVFELYPIDKPLKAFCLYYSFGMAIWTGIILIKKGRKEGVEN